MHSYEERQAIKFALSHAYAHLAEPECHGKNSVVSVKNVVEYPNFVEVNVVGHLECAKRVIEEKMVRYVTWIPGPGVDCSASIKGKWECEGCPKYEEIKRANSLGCVLIPFLIGLTFQLRQII